MTKKIFLKHNDHPQRITQMKNAIESGLACPVEVNQEGTLYQVPSESYKALFAVKRFRGGILNKRM